ncbi:MAG: class I SAM-dependent methyltransferase [Acidobacteriota bacterium]|nr:class I SAM-dependent methyltransferase [Acidobacteriota bacterium]
MPKKYDRAYFDRWYRGRARIGAEPEVRRKVAMAVAIAEFFLRRTIRNVVDIGCGEAPWFVHLRELRPKVRYVGYDPGDYAVEQFGASRNVRCGAFGEIGALHIRERFDLVVCADVMHYLQDDEIRRGLPAIVRLIRGAAFFEVLTREEEVMGDTVGLIRRPAAWYREVFTGNGLVAVGPYTWIGKRLANAATALERP